MFSQQFDETIKVLTHEPRQSTVYNEAVSELSLELDVHHKLVRHIWAFSRQSPKAPLLAKDLVSMSSRPRASGTIDIRETGTGGHYISIGLGSSQLIFDTRSDDVYMSGLTRQVIELDSGTVTASVAGLKAALRAYPYQYAILDNHHSFLIWAPEILKKIEEFIVDPEGKLPRQINMVVNKPGTKGEISWSDKIRETVDRKTGKVTYVVRGMSRGNDAYGRMPFYFPHTYKSFEDAIVSMCRIVATSLAMTREADGLSFPTTTDYRQEISLAFNGAITPEELKKIEDDYYQNSPDARRRAPANRGPVFGSNLAQTSVRDTSQPAMTAAKVAEIVSSDFAVDTLEPEQRGARRKGPPGKKGHVGKAIPGKSLNDDQFSNAFSELSKKFGK